MTTPNLAPGVNAPTLAAKAAHDATTSAEADLRPVPCLRLVPVSRDRAHGFISEHHRHLDAPVQSILRVGIAAGDGLVGVAVAGRPVARKLDDGLTLEVTRTCTLDAPNGVSMLLGAIRRAARALGYRRLVTYTRADEPGTSLRASGWVAVADLPPRPGWDMPSRPRKAAYQPVGRTRWEVSA